MDRRHGRNVVFAGGDNNTKYHVALDFAALTDKLGAAVPMNDCRKIYMVFAPRFEAAESESGGRLLPVGGGERSGDATWPVDDTSQAHRRPVLHRGRRPTRSACCWRPRSQDAGHRPARLRGHDGAVLAGWRAHEEDLAQERVRVRRGVGRDHLEHRCHRRRQPEGRRRGRRGSRRPTRGASTPAFGRTTSTARPAGRRSGGARATRSAPRPPTAGDVRKVRSPIRRRRSTTSTSGRSSTPTAARSASPWTAWRRRTIFISTSTAARRRI